MLDCRFDTGSTCVANSDDREFCHSGMSDVPDYVLCLGVSLTLAEIWAHNLIRQTKESLTLGDARWGAGAIARQPSGALVDTTRVMSQCTRASNVNGGARQVYLWCAGAY